MTTSTPYGGTQWSPRTRALREEMAEVWGDWGCNSECGRLRAVLLHRPGPELEDIADPDAMQMREPVDPARARDQHDALAAAYREHGVTVHYLANVRPDKPNAMFVRDLMATTPEGAIVARPASTVRAGEERYVAEALGRLGVPILLTVHGRGVFEGADLIWANEDLAFVAQGLRTNDEGARQVEALLRDLGVPEIVRVQLPYGSMHLQGVINFPDRRLAAIWPGRTSWAIVEALRRHGFRILEPPDEHELHSMALNFVALEPGCILMATGNPITRRLYQEAGVECVEVDISELIRAAGGMGCLTGILKREEL